jgi:hypothetical protein
MKYEAPELIVLAPAIDAIQTAKQDPGGDLQDDSPAYQDWE